jgi:nitrile hydratase
MNGVHDMGGMDGFGPVQHEANEPVFHEPWEGRVWGMMLSSAGQAPSTIDAGRHQIERIHPARYLASSYYERWLARIEEGIVAGVALSREEIEAKIKEFAANPDLSVPRREDPAVAEQIAVLLRKGNPVTRTIRKKPRFAIGDRVVTRNLNPHGHTRLPRYARGNHGVITAHHGAHVFPDTNAHGLIVRVTGLVGVDLMATHTYAKSEKFF